MIGGKARQNQFRKRLQRCTHMAKALLTLSHHDIALFDTNIIRWLAVEVPNNTTTRTDFCCFFVAQTMNHYHPFNRRRFVKALSRTFNISAQNLNSA
ncbi:hypothetical protein CJF36_18865 [Pseudomonas lundensis]|nr:hypothetical protein CJF36_18865 [Pseudomonas lundensis]